MLRAEYISNSKAVQQQFSALFGFENLDKVKKFAEFIEELVPYNKFPIMNGSKR